MSNYDAIVIGAGCGGLTAATKLARSGRKVLLLERHNIPGGCATSFCRGRFEFEASLHQLSGVGTPDKPGPVYGMLDQLGALERIELVWEEQIHCVGIEGRDLVDLPADREKLTASLKQHFPAHSGEIDRYMDFLYRFVQQFRAIAWGHQTDPDPEEFALFFQYSLRDTNAVIDEFISDPALKICLTSYLGYLGIPLEKTPFHQMANLYVGYIENKPVHILGGSQALSNAFTDSFLEAGGEIRFSTAVEKILVDGGRVTGVVTENGETFSADYVVSNASSIDTYQKMIDAEHVPQSLVAELNGKEIGVSAFTVYLGLDCEPEELGISTPLSFLFRETDANAIYGDPEKTPKALGLTCYDRIHPQFSPPGSCQLALINLQYGKLWESVPAEEYTDVKYRYANAFIDLAERFYPGIRQHIEEVEVATPITHMRYLATPGGSIYGFSPYTKDLPMFSDPRSPIEGLYLAGAWVTGGGYQPTLMSGVNAARAILKNQSTRGVTA